MSENLTKYEQSRQRLLESLRVVGDDPGTQTPVHGRWASSTHDPDVHMKLVRPYRPEPFTFMLAHMEKGVVRSTTMPETIVIQCIAGKFRITDPQGSTQIIAAPGHVSVLGDIEYTYEAIEEVYNIMKVERPS